jgi:anaerobic selenocysteine-containing dehydrogenase
MVDKTKYGIVEKISMAMRLLPRPKTQEGDTPKEVITNDGELSAYPPIEMWDNWVELDASYWPEKVTKSYNIVPTVCFNCEAGCGLVAYVDKDDNSIKKFQGNPYHPASRGKNCAKGPATINQIQDPYRILYPMKRDGPRGSGKWKRVSWEEVIKDISSRVRKALEEERHNEVMYHVGRPGHEGFMQWVLKAWGVDAHNSHTNICSSGARTGYALWHKYDRPSADFANAKFILLISAQLESGHYFNPHAQRIIEAKLKGTKIATVDSRLSNTASKSDFWLPTYPGTEPALLLGIAKIILDEGLYNAEFLRDWVNWETYLKELHPNEEITFDNFIEALKSDYSKFTLDYIEQECRISTEKIPEIARLIGDAGTKFAYQNWRSASSGNFGGWQTARCIHFLAVLVGAVGTVGSTSPNSWQKFSPKVHANPPKQKQWNELLWPPEYPLTHYELGYLLPHLLKDGRGKVDVYFSRVFNPVWTHPDGFSWMEVLQNEELINFHVALTPTWNETAYFADYVLPMGHSAERHDITSYETHGATWIAFRQPVQREALRRKGKEVTHTYESNPGEVWEEDEFWLELSWHIDKDGALGFKQYFASPTQPDKRISIDEYYSVIFNNIPTLVEEAKKHNLTTLEYMKKYGAFEVEKNSLMKHYKPVATAENKSIEVDPETRVASVEGKAVGLKLHSGDIVTGFPTPSRKQEIYSTTMKEWGWPEYATPGYIKSHIHWTNMKEEENELCLVPTFRLPALVHSRSGNAKWLAEIHHTNPTWMNTKTAEKLGLKTGDLVRITTDIGYFVNKIWVTEGLRPDIIAISHHIGRWRRPEDVKNNVWATNTVKIDNSGSKWEMKIIKGIETDESSDPDTKRIFWTDGGVHQNITFPVHPDPISGMHTWHQKVKVRKAEPGDKYGDTFVDTEKSRAVYKNWLNKTRKEPRPNNLRRPLWLKRPFEPAQEMYYKK